jgi:hypothetical protein
MNAENIFDGLDDDELPFDCIESPFYENMRALFNIKLGELLQELVSEEFDEGDITLKLNLSIAEAYAEVAKPDFDNGGERKEQCAYPHPYADYEVKMTLKHTSKDKGRKNERVAFKYRDGRYIAIPVPTDQVTFDELSRRRGL